MKKTKSGKAKTKWKIALWIILAALVIYVFWANMAILTTTGGSIVSAQDAKEADAQCILVLGAKVDGNTPSPILKDRLDCGIELYKQSVAPKLLLTGDGGQNGEDEVTVMQKYALNAGVPPQDIFLDREGFDTYDSMYRAKAVYGVSNMVIVTQSYHLTRSIYIAHALGMEAVGVAAQPEQYLQTLRDLREVAARSKDFLASIIKPQIQVSGNAFPISSDGRQTT